MNKVDQLFVRACKSEDPDTRLKSVYRRFYCYGSEVNNKAHIINILARISDEYLGIKIENLIEELNTDKGWYYGLTESSDYFDQWIAVLVSKIRFSEVSKFEVLTRPVMYED